MTSFEQPDAGLLVEHLLPSLLGASHSLSNELGERNLFFGELGTALEMMHGRLTVISSPPRGAREDSQYPWLWRYVSHFTVGSESRAVQHAKLWAFHWKIGDEEVLELHVSSTNLTSSAFKNQLQAGWTATVPLVAKYTKKRLQGWGELLPFLDALGKSAGEHAKARIERLSELLGKAECPDGVTFVASTPGRDSRPARLLGKLKPSAIHILSPTIGEWNKRSLGDWCKEAGVAASNVHLKWIDTSHPWHSSDGWSLTAGACEVLRCTGVRQDQIKPGDRLADEHTRGDDRWSHAKLYLVRVPQKKARYLLITSANWSASAWGAGSKKPRNFELGVLLQTDWKRLEEVNSQLDAPFCADRVQNTELPSTLEWAEASWDGKRIALRARSTDSVAPVSVVVTFTGSTEESILLVKGEASTPWNDAERTPLAARFTQGAAVLEVDVLDLRSPAEFAKTPLPEVDPAVEKALREAFLLQRYGGPVVDPESIPGLGGDRSPAGVSAPAPDYAVPAWIESRAAFSVVDKWRAALDEAAAEAPRRKQILLDGKCLRDLFAGRTGAGAKLVAEELTWRLKGAR